MVLIATNVAEEVLFKFSLIGCCWSGWWCCSWYKVLGDG